MSLDAKKTKIISEAIFETKILKGLIFLKKILVVLKTMP
jgi:hypothetical protein